MRFSAIRIRLLLVIALTCVAPTAGAQTGAGGPATRQEVLLQQRVEKREHLSVETLSTWERRLLALEKQRFPENVFVRGFHGIRPVLGGMPAGSGFVAGGGYIRGLNGEWVRLTANVRYSTRGYTALDAEVTVPARRDRRVRAYVRAGYRDLTALDFFGLGPASRAQGRMNFRLEDRTVQTGLTLVPHRRLRVESDVGVLDIVVGSGSEALSPTARADPRAAPGFERQPDFLVSRAALTLDLRDQWTVPRAGVILRVETERYDDRDGSAFDFTRVAAEAQAHVPVGYGSRMLALRMRTSRATADRASAVPFYLMETLGGAQSLRGFREYRYRDTRNLLLNAEYRWEVWNYVDFTLFTDAGKVFSDAADLDLSDLRVGYGFGLRAHAPAGTVFRIDLARSREGVRLHIGGGPRF